MVWLVDVGKGALAVLLAQAVNVPQVAIVLAGTTAVIGHNWPVFIGFRGGRGVSTTIGVLLVLVTQPMLIVAVPATLALIVKRNVSLACAFLFIPLPFLCWLNGLPGLLVACSLFLPLLVGFTHFLRIKRAVVHQS
jgi:glycerol-3-phosphate acyltransferase PlsY